MNAFPSSLEDAAAGLLPVAALETSSRTLGAQHRLEQQILHLQQRNEALEKAHARAEQSSRAKSEFLANMSHEIRTPLTAILGFADLLHADAKGALTADQRLHALATIRNSGQHLLTVINDILDLSKIEAGKVTLERIAIPLVDVLQDVAVMMQQKAAGKGLTLGMMLANPLPAWVLGDPTRLRQIVMNLLGNAIKFTESGGVTLTLGIERREGPWLVIDVADTGPGMTVQQAARLFEPFSQSDGTMTRKHGGTGLGLVISRQLAILMGGNVVLARTEVGRGSCFRLELPLEPVSGAAWVTELDATGVICAAEPAAAVRLTGRVLLAEDGPENQHLIAFHLRKAGAEIDVAENGRIALSMLDAAARQGRPYQLLLTDMQMPEVDGYTLARTLRERGIRLPIVALTAHAHSFDRQKCLDAGCDDYVQKPIDKAALLTMCGKWMQSDGR